MVDLTNPDFKEGGPIEHAFSNWVFVFPAIVTIGLVGRSYKKYKNHLRYIMDEETVLENQDEGGSMLAFYSVFIVIPVGVIGFFTWKLIKSLREKEKKKEEKKKLKMQRKEVKKKK